MGSHDWLDVIGWFVVGAVSLIAVVLGARLARHDQERKETRETLNRHGERLAGIESIIELIKQTFRFK